MLLVSRCSLPVLAVLGLVGVAGCGDDAFTTSDGGGGAGTSSTASTSGTTTSTGTGEGGAPGTGGAPATTGTGGAPGSGGGGGAGGAPGVGGSGGAGGTGGDGGAPGSGGGGTGGASCDDIPTTEIPGDACDAVAAAFCAQLEACVEPVFLIIAGTEAECLLLVAEDCRREQGLPGQDESADEVETCAETLVNASCECAGLACSESFGVGTLLDGAPCEVDGQCASGFCDDDGDACGACQPLVPMGGSCADPDAECAQDLFCDDDETCQPYRAAGEECSDNDQCGPDDFGGEGARCVDGVCGPGVEPGASCLGNEEACTGFAICSPLSSTCEPLGIAGPDEACGFDLRTGDIAICRGDLICSDQLGGTCLPRGALDAECALDEGGEPTEPSDHDCLPHLACIEGTCQPIPDVVCE